MTDKKTINIQKSDFLTPRISNTYFNYNLNNFNEMEYLYAS